MPYQQIILFFLPICFLLFYWFQPYYYKKQTSIVVLLIILAVFIGTYPAFYGTDKYLYTNAFYRYVIYNNSYDEIFGWVNDFREFDKINDYSDRAVDYENLDKINNYKDIGWVYYYKIFIGIAGDRDVLFFIVTAFLYVFSIYFFARQNFIKNKEYFILMSVGCLGFLNYGYNTIRAGLALAILMYGFCFRSKWIRMIFAVIAVQMHFSLIIPTLAYCFTFVIQSRKLAFMIWGICVILSIANINIESFFEVIDFADKRISLYMDTLTSKNDRYRSEFRVDFLVYSIIPIVISYHHLLVVKFSQKSFYSHILNTYLITNSLWLLVIRIAYSDRIAYLSWFMIPFITLYPVLTFPQKYSNPQKMALQIMTIFMGINFFLFLRPVINSLWSQILNT